MKKVISFYSAVLLAVMLVVTCIVYWVTPIWTNRFFHYTMTTEIDKLIPFRPEFVIPYVLAYIQWGVGFFLIARTDKKYSTHMLGGTIISKLITGLLFVVVPTTMDRAVISGTDLFSKMVSYIYQADPAINLFPSIHCLDSWICFRSSFNREYFSPGYSFAMGIFTAFVILSTVFIKQHVIIDALGALAVAEAGLLLGKRMARGL